MAVLITALFSSCNEQEAESPRFENEVSSETIAQLNSMGFNTVDFPVVQHGNEIIVENDILLKISDLKSKNTATTLASVEQYSTDNLVEGLPRRIDIYVNPRFNSNYTNATDAAIARYNAEGLSLTFQRINTPNGAEMVIDPSPFWYGFFGILGSAGFPTDGGDAFNSILLTRSFYDNVSDLSQLTTTIAHEMGHCIGFRHSDYANRSFSCSSGGNEGDGEIGANFIPGTNPDPDANSWMLACSGGSDRPFNANDKIALDFLY